MGADGYPLRTEAELELKKEEECLSRTRNI